MDIIAWYNAHMSIVIAVLSAIVAVDHILASIPSVQSNATFQLVANLIAKAYAAATKGQDSPPPAA